MKKIKLLIVVLFLLFIFPIKSFAYNNYKDVFGPKINQNNEKVTIYLFYRDGCPHCAKEKEFLKDLQKDYSELNVVLLQYSDYPDEYELAKTTFNVAGDGVPLTLIGEEYYLGFSDIIKENMTSQVKNIFGKEKKEFVKEYKIPLIGNVDAKSASIPLVTVILGFIDGFNPCAMWILIFILSILINLKDRKKMLIIGSIFLLTSAIIYYLSILGISSILSIKYVEQLRVILGIVAIIVGLFNIYNWIKSLKDTGCTVVDANKRKSILERVNGIINAQSLIIMIASVIVLAISVNALEMACSLGFPAIFSEILAVNKVTGLMKYLYILLYIIFYMIDDVFVFLIAVFTFKIFAFSNKISKVIKLIAAIIMIAMGILLIFFPNIVMLNF